MDNLLAIMKQFDLPVSVVDAKEAKDKCPYITVPDNFVGVFEEDAGILATSKCVTALQVKYIISQCMYQAMRCIRSHTLCDINHVDKQTYY